MSAKSSNPRLLLTAVSAQNAGVNTYECYLLDGQASRTFSDGYCGFDNLRYDKDLFSGYHYQMKLTAGIGGTREARHLNSANLGLWFLI